jgi:phosphatidylglycerol:prolipoprotein diacylglycerol transferase
VHPSLLHIGSLTLPTYGLLAAVGLILALSLSLRTAALTGVSPDRLWNAGLFALIAAFVLSRLLLVLENLHTFLAFPILLLMVPSLTPLGLGLTAVATAIYLRTRSIDMLNALDAWTPCATLAWIFLALGHFAEGSDPGLPSRLPWAVALPSSSLKLHPVAIYVAIAAAALTVLLLKHLSHRHREGDTAALGLAASGLVQFLLSFLREPAYYDNTLGRLLDPIQWLSIGMIVSAAVLWGWPRRLVSHAV